MKNQKNPAPYTKEELLQVFDNPESDRLYIFLIKTLRKIDKPAVFSRKFFDPTHCERDREVLTMFFNKVFNDWDFDRTTPDGMSMIKNDGSLLLSLFK
jgi:hypothetical protein